jgi:hypothetical protein
MISAYTIFLKEMIWKYTPPKKITWISTNIEAWNAPYDSLQAPDIVPPPFQYQGEPW